MASLLSKNLILVEFNQPHFIQNLYDFINLIYNVIQLKCFALAHSWHN